MNERREKLERQVLVLRSVVRQRIVDIDFNDEEGIVFIRTLDGTLKINARTQGLMAVQFTSGS